MSSHIVELIDILNTNKSLIRESLIDMLKKKQTCPEKEIEIRAKVIFVALLALLCDMKKGNYSIKNHSNILFYRSIFFYIFNNISYVHRKKSVIKRVYLKLNTLKKICQQESDKHDVVHSTRSTSSSRSSTASSSSSDSSSSLSEGYADKQTLSIFKTLSTPDSSIISTPKINIDTITTPVSCSGTTHLTSINDATTHSYELNPKYDCDVTCLDSKDKLVDSHKVLGLLKILLCTLEKDLSHKLAQINLKEPTEEASDVDIDFINRLLYIFFSQYLTIITKHCNLFFNKTGPDTYKIKFGDSYISVCTLDNLDIKEDKIEGEKVILMTVGKHISIMRYAAEGTNDTLNRSLTDSIDNLSTAISIINTNYKILDSCLEKLCQMSKIIDI